MPQHVLHILGTAEAEGTSIAKIVCALADGLDPKRYRVHAWFLRETGPLVAELQKCCASVRVVDWRGGAHDPAGAWRFFRSLRREQFAIIHQHFGGRSVRWLARKASRAHVIVHRHGRVSEADSFLPVRIVIRDADAVIANSCAVAKQVVGLSPHVVYPGVCAAASDQRHPHDVGCGNGLVIGTAGRLVPIKGIQYLLRAVVLLRAEVPNLRLEIAGAGPEQTSLEKEVRMLSLADNVTFLGWRADMTKTLARWDVFALPSLEEGFGLTALEAMAVGLPVVATAVGGIPELVKDGQTGWLVPPGDSVALAKQLRALLFNSEQRHTMGNAGRLRAREHFSAQRMVTAIENIYESLLASIK